MSRPRAAAANQPTPIDPYRPPAKQDNQDVITFGE